MHSSVRHQVKKEILSNGLKLVSVSMPHLHSVELAVYIKAGSRNDPPDKSGLSHLLEHMLFRGTKDYPTTLQLESAFENIGGNVNASTDEECTSYFTRIHPDYLDAGISCFSSMILRPLLDQLETEKKIIIEEALEDINECGEEINPHSISSRMFWGDQPLGRSTIGTPETISSITLEDVLKHSAMHYLPENSVIVAAGKVDHEHFINSVNRHFSSWHGRKESVQESCDSTFTGPQVRFVDDSDSQVHLQISFISLKRNDRRFPAYRILRRLIAGAGSSHLHIKLREEMGIVYSVDANISGYEETGYFSIELFTSPENLAEAVRGVLEELSSLKSETISNQELSKFKKMYLYEIDYSIDSPYEMQIRYGWGELMNIRQDIDDERRELLRVTVQDLRALAAEIFNRRNMALVAVGEVSEERRKRIIEAVEAFV